MDSKDKVDDFINNKLNSDEREFKPFFNIKNFYINGMKVFSFGDKHKENTILYIHGGAYINEINYQHLIYCYMLSGKLNAHVLAHVYPLAPKHNVEETYNLIVELYKKLDHDNLILMGDSAGGGFVHSF